MEAIHPTLKKYGKGNFTEAEEHLFGETFKETLVKKVEADSVLSKAVNIATRSSRGREGHYQTTTSRSFFWKPGKQVRGCLRQIIQPVKCSQSVVHRERETDHRSPLLQERRTFQLARITEHRQKPPKVQPGPQKLDDSLPHAGRI